MENYVPLRVPRSRVRICREFERERERERTSSRGRGWRLEQAAEGRNTRSFVSSYFCTDRRAIILECARASACELIRDHRAPHSNSPSRELPPRTCREEARGSERKLHRSALSQLLAVGGSRQTICERYLDGGGFARSVEVSPIPDTFSGLYL